MHLQTRYVTEPDSWGQDNGVWNRAEAEDKLLIQFQSGPVATRDVNGVMPYDVLQVVLDQLKAQQRVDGLKSRERALVITKIQEAQHWERTHQESLNTPDATVERAMKGGGR